MLSEDDGHELLLLQAHSGTTLQRHLLSGELSLLDALHPWKEVVPLPAAEVAAAIDIYFLRHGDSTANRYRAAHHNANPPNTLEAEFWDAPLTAKGVSEAVAASKMLDNLNLTAIQASHLQLGSSLYSRAFDTLIIAAQLIWRAWVSQSFVRYRIHGIPAVTAYDRSVESNRRSGVAADDPVFWDDSALAGELAGAIDLTDAKQFYRDAEDHGALTVKPVEVRADYKGVQDSTCPCQQMHELERYLIDVARLGKSHILLATHGVVVSCASSCLALGPLVRTTKGSDYNLKYQIPTGSVLHLKMQVPTGASAKANFELGMLHFASD